MKGKNILFLILWAASLFVISVPLDAHPSQEFYTVQTGSFSVLKDARKHYDVIAEKIPDEYLDFLRIEKIGDYFCIRIGKFEDRSEAEELFHVINNQFPSAMMRRAYIKEERVKLRYSRRKSSRGHDTNPASDFRSEIITSWVSLNPDDSKSRAAIHEKNGNIFLKTGDYFRAAEEFRMAIDKGLKNPVTYWKLSEALYEIKFVDEAINELEKAVALSPKNEVLKIELAKLYLVKNRLKDAREQLLSALKINPCSADLHYYLGEIFLRANEYDRAWYSAKAAAGLGHRSNNLSRKLSLLSQEPESYPWSKEDDLYIRQILVEDSETADKILKRITDGELFEDIADVETKIPGKPLGGYMGRYSISELHPKISEALISQKVFADPVIVKTENGFHIVQRVANFDFYFEDDLLAGSE